MMEHPGARGCFVSMAQLQSQRDVPVNMGGAHPRLSMLVHQSWLQVPWFTIVMSFFCSELLLALLGFRNWAEEEFRKCKTLCYPFTVHMV